MKRWFAAMAAAVMLLGAVGCTERTQHSSSKTDPESGSSSSQPEVPLTTPTPVPTPTPTPEPTPAAPTLGADYARLAGLDANMQGWGQGVQVDEKNRPIGSTAYQEKYGKYDAFFIMPGEENEIYLTFDQGYENGYTAPILDTLKEKHVSAVFFLTLDYAKKNPDLIRRMIDEGHVLGNHSASHKNYPELPLEEAHDDAVTCHEYVKETYGYDMTLFRFPAGNFSEQTLALMQEMGYRSLFWSFAYKDWLVDDQPDPAAALEKVTKMAHPGAIYLLHSVSKTNAGILGDVIDQLRAQGYTFKKYL